MNIFITFIKRVFGLGPKGNATVQYIYEISNETGIVVTIKSDKMLSEEEQLSLKLLYSPPVDGGEFEVEEKIEENS